MPATSMAKLSTTKRLKSALTPSFATVLPLFCLGLLLLPLLLQRNDSVNDFIRAKFNSYTADQLPLEEVAKSPQPSNTNRTSFNDDNNISNKSTSERNSFSDSNDDQAEDEDEDEESARGFKLAEPVRKLVEAIRAATREAWGGEPVPMTDDERREWERKNPCRSRAELKLLYAQRKHMKDVPDNEQWKVVVAEYAELHRACTTRIGDLQAYFKAQNSSVAGCRFIVAETHFGLGNKVYQLSSVFMYAVLSQRVMLVPESTSVPAVVCQPFAGSSWTMKERFVEEVRKRRKPSLTFYDDVDLAVNGTRDLATFASAMSNKWGPEPRFWCDTEQRFLTRVPWLTIDGCLLFLHKLYAVDMFRPALEALFPDRIVLTRILRTLMLPADPVWERILHVNEVYLQNAAKQVGIQVRFLSGEKEYEAKNELINERITRCLWENKILPEVCPARGDPGFGDPKFAACAAKLTREDHQRPRIVKVLIASLFLGLHDSLNEIYLRHEITTTKEVVGIIQLTHEKIQGTGVEVDSQAFVEIISLSMSDVLVVTPQSTFGGLAQAYGGLVPWFIEFAKKKGEPDQCERGMGIEPCYLGANIHYDCKYDAPGTQDIPDLLPYLRSCLFIDVGSGYGMQMVPDKLEDHDFSLD
ncbi:xyloglucan fucosyltransferase [Marchantia polymorpha subsp. ruderalis]|uniref:Fucosyltransferase n=1 Tax=Marchantia polymorpha TaxID=3197 RepID=A0A2R6XDM4_MARPO|nr:hypothetical protein MARPO_0021s0069 [Marchantia polymorpha]BBN01280.1 hypothetical protein Mp_2g06140 [Marchantia polymorpha subsp. ruderalis]|eukprot:PTQ44205.1 hypothetical protein MARPO_0021s0069 [Marchantia polymorpha]